MPSHFAAADSARRRSERASRRGSEHASRRGSDRGALRLGPRILLVTIAAAVAAGGAAWPLALPLVVAASVATVECCVRSRRRGLLDAVAVGVGGWLVAVILVGLVLAVLPGGLARSSWAIALGVVGIAALLVCRRRPPQEPIPALSSWWPRPVNLALYVGAGSLVLAALVGSVLSAQGEQPDLQLSVRRPDTLATSPVSSVVVSASAARGPLQLVVDTGRGARLLGGPFVVDAGRSHTASVRVPDGSRVTVSLVDARDRSVLRWVSLDRSPSTSADHG